MGIFRELTEDEKNQKNILRAIRESNLPENIKSYWTMYVNGVYAGTKINNFFEKEYLIRVILEMISTENNDYEYAYYTVATSDWLKSLIPSGTSDPEYKAVMEIFVNNFMNIIHNRIGAYFLNTAFITLFDSKVDAIEIILNFANLDEQDINIITKYALEVAPYS